MKAFLKFVGLGCLALCAQANEKELLSAVPTVVGETSVALPIARDIDGTWRCSGQLSVKKAAANWMLRSVVDIAYSGGPDNPDLHLDYVLKEDHPAAERLRFWIKGDGSNSDLLVLCYYAPKEKWISLASVKLDFQGWRHLEIPAGNPIHRFHSAVTRFRFKITSINDWFSGGIMLSGMELVTPKLVKLPLKEKEIPSPFFNTWGGADKEHISFAPKIGTTMHMAVIDGPTGGDASNRVDYATKAVEWCRDFGIMPGIAFYNNPGPAYMASHQDMLVKNSFGKRYDRHGGAFTSPWNPAAREMWREHIIRCLEHLKAREALQHVRLVELCPGEESEVSFEWGHVWAFDEHAIKAYHAYLETLYGNDIVKLNADWGSSHASFGDIVPPEAFYPDRAHWVFADFYRLSMLRYCVFLADSVRRSFTPEYWLWMTHTIGAYPQRFYAARYPLFYAENMRRLGCLDYAQLAALDWQTPEDVDYLRRRGVRVIGEVDVAPTPERLEWTFGQCRKFGTDGVFIGVLEIHSEDGQLTSVGKLCRKLIQNFDKERMP